MVKAVDLIRLWRQALADKWGYIWGTAGKVWTQAQQSAATRETTIKYGSRWIGHHVADCSGLGDWAFRQLGGKIYHGSNTIWNQYVTDRCQLKDGKRTDGKPILPGDPVFLVKMVDGVQNRHHIGYFVGDTCIEAKSTLYGVVTSPLTHWHETAHWGNVEYEGGEVYVIHPTLRLGSAGDDVKYLQTLLRDVGEPLTVDGQFGPKTEQAVKAFQMAANLTPDGVVGPKTWDALEQATGHNPDAPQPPEDEPEMETVTVPRPQLDALRQWLANALDVVENLLNDTAVG